MGRPEPLVAWLMGATTATRVGEGADWRFFGGRAGGLEGEEKGASFQYEAVCNVPTVQYPIAKHAARATVQ